MRGQLCTLKARGDIGLCLILALALLKQQPLYLFSNNYKESVFGPQNQRVSCYEILLRNQTNLFKKMSI